MRFYDLAITNPNTNATLLHYSSYAGLQPNPTALNVILDLFVVTEAAPVGNSTITIEGVTPAILQNAKNYYKMQLSLRGGMGAGLPLANPKQAGLIASGEIIQVFGNWAGTEISLSMVLIPSPYTLQNPGNIVLNWRAGTPLATALQNTLSAAFPKSTIKINIGAYTLSHDEIGPFSTTTQLAQYLSGVTGGAVQMVVFGNTISVFDGSYQPPPIQLAFNDFIGQPMWLDPNTIQIKTTMRGDISVGSMVKMPVGFNSLPEFVQTTAASLPSFNNYQSAIQGQFVIYQVRHIGNLRQPNGNAWCSVFNAVAATPQ